MEVLYMNGAGNDFMVIDARDLQADLQALALKLCPITGADGFLALDHSDIADFKLHFYNADGLRGEMCGNGARCICKFAYDHGLCGENITVETDAGLVYGWHLGENQYRVQLNNPGILDLHRKEDVAYVELGDPGIPHSIKEIPGLSWEQAPELFDEARALRYDPAFPKGSNITFYTRLDDTTVRVLTYERGVEDYTLACGTGCASVASVLWSKGQLPGGRLIAYNRGGTLTISLEAENGKIRKLMLEGPAELAGVYNYEF